VLESLPGTDSTGAEFLLSRFNSVIHAGILGRGNASVCVSNPAACGGNAVREQTLNT
jgi:hypothetical protein